MSLWFNGPCFWVHILQQLVREGANECSFMWWALPQVGEIYVLLFLFNEIERSSLEMTRYVQKIAKLYASMPRDLSPQTMPIPWKVFQKGNYFVACISILWEKGIKLCTQVCECRFWFGSPSIYLSNFFSFTFPLQGYCSLWMSDLEKGVVMSWCSSSLSQCWFWSQRHLKKSIWTWSYTLQFWLQE